MTALGLARTPVNLRRQGPLTTHPSTSPNVPLVPCTRARRRGASGVPLPRYPFSTPPASRIPEYSADVVPNARDFLETWIRWFWTEKYTEEHIRLASRIIHDVAKENAK